jgi:hypothetical protein
LNLKEEAPDGYPSAMDKLGAELVTVEDAAPRVIIPDSPLACLMYYLHCVNQIANFDLSPRLTNFVEWRSVPAQDRDEILATCETLNPKDLSDKRIFIWDNEGRRCPPTELKFMSIKEAGGFIDTETMIAGRTIRVTQVMVFGQVWVSKHYLQPMQSFQDYRQSRRAATSVVPPGTERWVQQDYPPGYQDGAQGGYPPGYQGGYQQGNQGGYQQGAQPGGQQGAQADSSGCDACGVICCCCYATAQCCAWACECCLTCCNLCCQCLTICNPPRRR